MATKKSQDIEVLGYTTLRPAKRRKLSPPSAPSEGRKRSQDKKPSKTIKPVKSTSKNDLSPRPPRQRRSVLQSRSRTSLRSAETPNLSPSRTASKATSKSNSGLSTPSSDTNNHNKIIFTKSLLDQIWTRNKNQHRTQPWWKCLGMLRKALTKLALLDDKEIRFRPTTTSDGKNDSTATSVDAKAVRLRFEQEALVKKERDVWVEWIRETLLPRSYVAFTSLVSDTQFANLGMVLVGVLADVTGVVGEPTSTTIPTAVVPGFSTLATEPVTSQCPRKPNGLSATSLRVTGSRTGERVDRYHDGDDMGEVVERKPTLSGNGKTSRSQKEKDTGSDAIVKTQGVRSTEAAPLVLHDDDEEEDDDDGAEEKSSVVHNRRQSLQRRATQSLDDTSPSMGNLPKPISQTKPLPPSSTTSESGRPDLNGKKTTPTRKDEKRKKKKTKGGAIDDLFAGLI
ncbi:uncharacterized protein PV06_02800 [Exophiala oligosperma]|uniref:RNase MRP protein 1 RNA binding domain-containing protein n=1 Tax=Exophiala oligosperma TaxID=215243 RepID=A0A0D2DVU4_9EURO|nr:uncharacterized protein PV06_02800 [Exophiala oligosperma]KIW47208.1 hypothetical protein PV06_02800 [Exophiala oligosperma]